MSTLDPGPEAVPQQAPPRWRHGFTLAIALLGVLLAWVPGLGLLLSLAGLVMGLWGRRHRVRPRSSSWAVAIAILGLILGAGFTGLQLFLLPDGPGDEERALRERFDRLFDPPAAPGARDGPAAEP